MHYVGTIDKSSKTGEPGKEFDASTTKDEPFNFQVGAGEVIDGWDQGLIGLCKGAKAKLVIPPEMGYGEEGAGDDIPAGATLHFDVEVLDVSDEPLEEEKEENLFAALDANKDNKLTKAELLSFFKGDEDLPEGIWEEEDKDGDGFISWEEFNGPKGEGKPEL